MKRAISVISITLFFASCSVNHIAVKKTAEIIDNGTPEIFSDSNLKYIKASLPANLKLMEILYQTDKDPKLVKNMAMGFCGYAFAFLDDDKDNRNDFYIRGIRYSDDYINSKKLMEKKDVKGTDFDILFWNTFCKSSYLDMNRDDLAALNYLGEVETQSEKLFEINPNYFYKSLYTILGSIYASKPKMIGGDIDKAKKYFDEAVSGTGSKLLINRYIYARIYPQLADDEALFDKIVDEILNYKNDDESIAFFNEVAKEKTAKLKEMKNEIF
ncbi:MAG: hypothetical protein GX445_05220 [Elusimicrobia bacterium]|nr:hypothetical protein [Elusimicrobiota bacterium]